MNDQDIRLIRELQNGIKLERRPFLRLARELNLTEQQVLDRVRTLQQEGVIRRVGISVRPQQIGYACNALIAWKVDAARIEEVGTALAKTREVSHCYERETPEGWPYNLFTMVHARTPEHLEEIVQKFRTDYHLNECKVYKTVKELKKTSMRYFAEEGHGKNQS